MALYFSSKGTSAEILIDTYIIIIIIIIIWDSLSL